MLWEIYLLALARFRYKSRLPGMVVENGMLLKIAYVHPPV
jgi:hypothetical protein